MQSAAQHIFNHLTGSWHFQRKIKDIYKATTVHAQGKANFYVISSDEPKRLQYEERGKLFLPKKLQPVSFTRRYVYELIGDIIHIWLDDGMTSGDLFQSLIPQEKIGHFIGTAHLCRLDIHKGKYFFSSESSFDIAYEIEGPQTHLEILSNFVRLSNPSHNI